MFISDVAAYHMFVYAYETLARNNTCSLRMI